VSRFCDELETVIGLNSVISSGEERLERSKIEPKQLIKRSHTLDNLPPRPNYFRIAVFYHDPFSVPRFSRLRMIGLIGTLSGQ
jgi:hypothetical protein